MFTRKILPLCMALFFFLMGTVEGAPWTGVWEVKSDELKVVRLEIQKLTGDKVKVKVIEKNRGAALRVYEGKGTVRGNSLSLKVFEGRESKGKKLSLKLAGKKLSARWKEGGQIRSHHFVRPKETLPLGSTEVFFGDRWKDMRELPDKLGMIKSVELALNVDFQNKEIARGRKIDAGLFKIKNGARIQVVAKAKKNPRSPKDLMVEKLVLRAPETIRIADRFHIRSVTINRKGHISFNVKNFPDLTITRIEKKSNGDTRLHIDNFPDLTVKKNGALKLWGFIKVGEIKGIDLPEWPQSLNKVLEFFLNKKKTSEDSGDTMDKFVKSIGSIDYNLKAVTDPKEAINLAGQPIKTNGATMELKGKLKSEKGKLISDGDGKVKVHIGLGRNRIKRDGSETEIKRGSVDMEGLYRVEIPMKKEGKMVAYFDGRASYEVEGGTTHVYLPDQASLFLDGYKVSGENKIKLKDLKKGLEITDGQLHLTSSGPARIKALDENSSFYWGDMDLNHSLLLDSRYELKDNKFVTENSLYAMGEVANPRGVIDALRFEDPKKKVRGETRLKEKSRIEINMDKITTTHRLGESLKKMKVDGQGRINYNVKVSGGEASYDNFKALLKGEGSARGEANFGFSNGEDGFRIREDSAARTKVKFALKPGTKLRIRQKNGQYTTIKVKGNNSYLHFEVKVVTRNGQPHFEEARNVNVLLQLGNIESRLLGMNVTGRGKKTLVLENGTVRLLDSGVDVYGDLAVRIEGVEDEPVLSLRW